MAGEPDGGVEQGLAGAPGALVGHLGDGGEAGVIVDDDLEVVVAGTRPSARVMRRSVAPEQTVAAAVGDPSELLCGPDG